MAAATARAVQAKCSLPLACESAWDYQPSNLASKCKPGFKSFPFQIQIVPLRYGGGEEGYVRRRRPRRCLRRARAGAGAGCRRECLRFRAAAAASRDVRRRREHRWGCSTR